MDNVQVKCPVCGEIVGWKRKKTRKGFSVGKSIAGGVLLGPLGLAAGALGKTNEYYECENCGYNTARDNLQIAKVAFAENMKNGTAKRGGEIW